jgi:serine protease Do
MKRLIWFIGLFLLLLGCANAKEKYVNVISSALPKTVEVFTVTASPDSPWTKVYYGAGALISPNGHIVSCAHLFDQNTVDITIGLYDEMMYKGELLAIQPYRDLALLKIEEINTPYMMIADPRKVIVGQEVLAIGHPLGFDYTVTNGLISGMYRDFGLSYNMLQTNAAINPGNSGGPLFNLQGELVGINSRLMSPIPAFTGLGFAVSSAQIIELLAKYRDITSAVRTW